MTYVGTGETDARLAPPAQVLDLGATRVRVLADVAATDGRYSLYGLDLPADGGTATPHFHRTFSESFLVLDGEVELYDGREWVAVGAGAHLYIPPGSVHGYRNHSGQPASMLMLTCPGARREDYFAALAEIAAGGRRPSPEEWTALLAAHDQYSV
ncbi:cupin domain-containing protein [Egicoccus sp. AB-alg2]|uniref:cupin domain-containing protein n=1 Tax=Egicoccus sp. AB-alg2 TaxID=3242693 RepID=UPI00359D857A